MNVSHPTRIMDDTAFRILPPSPDDLLSTTIRIEKSQMERLGIKTGEIVKVTGVRTIAATCLPIDDGFSMPSDPDIIYLENTPVLPQARPGGITIENLSHRGGEGLGQVRIEKTESHVAEKISLVKVKPTRSSKSQFDESKLFGLVASKNDRIYFRDEDYQLSFGCTVKDVQPEGFCIVDKNTILEFSDDLPRQRVRHVNRGDFHTLMKVIPISHQTKKDMFTITIPSLEIYEEGLRCHLYINGTYGENNFQFVHSHVSLDIIVRDNFGNQYDIAVNGRGGSSGPNRFDYEWEGIIPPANKDAKEIILIIQEIRWQANMQNPETTQQQTKDMRRNNLSIHSKITHKRLRYSEIEKFPSSMICTGPWEVKIPL